MMSLYRHRLYAIVSALPIESWIPIERRTYRVVDAAEMSQRAHEFFARSQPAAR